MKTFFLVFFVVKECPTGPPKFTKYYDCQKSGFFMLDPHFLHRAPLTSEPHDKHEYFNSVLPERNPPPILSSLKPKDFRAFDCLDLM